jgi:glycine/D-amino acid oxidase-like deaminating enzyme
LKHASVTEKRKLREAFPYWQKTPNISVRSKRYPTRRHYDVVVVGGGISGALVAHALIDGKRTIAVIDRQKPVLGSTIASTAMLQHEIDVPLYKLKKMIKAEDAERVWLRSAAGVKGLIELVKNLDISCSMQPKKALYLAGDDYGSRALISEVEARKAIGLDATLLDRTALMRRFGVDREAAIKSNISASANPAQLAAGILRVCQRQGVEIISDTEITDFVEINEKVALATSMGNVLSTSHVVFCTGYEFLKSLANKEHQIISTWAIASRQAAKAPEWLRDYLVWEASDPYLYFRSGPDGRIIAGGEDEPSDDAFEDEKKRSQKSSTIAKKVGALLGFDMGKPDYSWSAAFGSTKLGTPMIGAVPGHANVYSAMGYGGNGITFSKIASEIIASMLAGKDDPDADVFAFR